MAIVLLDLRDRPCKVGKSMRHVFVPFVSGNQNRKRQRQYLSVTLSRQYM
jgi:hypothetical protein